ncbi:unnamed protein product [Withania somnifera]
MFKNGEKVQLKCIYYGKLFKGGGIHRIKEHLVEKTKLAEEISTCNEVAALTDSCGMNTEVDFLPIPKALELTSNLFLNRDEGGNNTGGRKKKSRIRKASSSNNNAMVLAINRSKRENNHAVNSFYFQPMIDVIASQGAQVASPSYYDLEVWVLKASIQEVRNDIDQCSITQGKEWLFCFGTMFLRSVDASSLINSMNSLYELLKEVVEEVGVRNVLQVVTSNEERYVILGKRLTEAYPTLFWTPCAAHSIDLMLEDIKKLEWIDKIMEQAKSISRFIYNNNILLSMMRKFTFGVDLVDLGATHSATDFLTLKRMVNIKHNLQSMVTSMEWMESPYSKKPEGSFWSMCGLISRLKDPILRLLRIVCNEERPAMAYVYAGVYRAKETIKKELVNKKDYSVYWNIIDHGGNHIGVILFMRAGFYLNPKFFYTAEEDVHLHIRSLLYDCIEKLVLDPKIQDKIVKETTSYHERSWRFWEENGGKSRDTLLHRCPNLARLAMRILGQTSSLIESKPGQIPLEEMHETKNCIEHQRLNDLTFVRYNLWPRQRTNKEPDCMDSISYGKIVLVHNWVSGRELSSRGHGMFRPDGFFGGPKDNEEEIGEENTVNE